MILPILTLIGGAAAVVLPRAPVRIAIGNDDGWATANVRALFNAVDDAGFDVILSCPAVNKSGSSSFDGTPQVIGKDGGEFGSIPPGAPAIGTDANDSRINYVNSFPVTAIKHGISVVAPRELGGKPDLVLSGPNVGGNLGLITQFSGTIGAASEAAGQGIPAIAFSGAGGTQHSFTEPDPVAEVYAQLAMKVTNAIVASGKPYLPNGIALNVNLPVSDATTCTSADDFTFVMSRVNFDINPFTDDVEHCGTNHLPTENSVISSGNCRVSISAFKTWSKLDVDKTVQTTVRDKLNSILTCLPA